MASDLVQTIADLLRLKELADADLALSDDFGIGDRGRYHAALIDAAPELLAAAARAERYEKALRDIKPLAFVANTRNFSSILRIIAAALADRSEVKE